MIKRYDSMKGHHNRSKSIRCLFVPTLVEPPSLTPFLDLRPRRRRQDLFSRYRHSPRPPPRHHKLPNPPSQHRIRPQHRRPPRPPPLMVLRPRHIGRNNMAHARLWLLELARNQSRQLQLHPTQSRRHGRLN